MHGWRLPTGKICLCFKTMKNFIFADPLLTMNSYTTQKVRLGGISLQPLWLANQN